MRVLSKLVAVVLLAAAPMASMAAPVSVTQTVALTEIGPFPTRFTDADFVISGWNAPFPFTQPSQISGITWKFASDVPLFNDPALWPTTDGGGIPGVELGVNNDAVPATRTALLSFTPSVSTFTMPISTAADLARFQLVRDLVADGAIQASLGGFFNFAGVSPPFSLSQSFSGAQSRVTLTLSGDVPTPVPEPGTIALWMAAALGVAALRRRSRA